jgi:hypothetical protein
MTSKYYKYLISKYEYIPEMLRKVINSKYPKYDFELKQLRKDKSFKRS